MDNLSPETLAVISGVLVTLFLGNIAAIMGFFVSMRVSVAKLEVKVDNNEKDINGLGDLIRSRLK